MMTGYICPSCFPSATNEKVSPRWEKTLTLSFPLLLSPSVTVVLVVFVRRDGPVCVFLLHVAPVKRENDSGSDLLGVFVYPSRNKGVL